jgi:hypothetical protein
MSEARTEDRLGRLERDVAEIRTTLAGLVPLIHRIDARLPYLATKDELTTGLSGLRSEIGAVRVELADKPGKMWLATAIGLLIVAYTAGLAGLAALPVITKLVR